jgi:hypothetical protein
MPSEQLAHTTVRLETVNSKGERATGTGFFFSCLQNGDTSVPVIITNKHVIEGAEWGSFHMTPCDENNDAKHASHFKITLDDFARRWFPHPDPAVDLAAMPIAPLLHEAEKKGTPLFFRTLDKTLLPTQEELDDLGGLDDVVMVGYPTGLWDTVNNMPILRRGVTATHPRFDYEGRSEFIIDAACFPGSSGSPVFLYNQNGWRTRNGNVMMASCRVRLLGVLYAGPQYTATGEIRIVNSAPAGHRPVALSNIPINLGCVIKSERLREFDDVLRPLIAENVPTN